MNEEDRNQPRTTERKAWTRPSVRRVISSRGTRGGPVANGPQEDFWYSIS
jgi:hypothetical protein